MLLTSQLSQQERNLLRFILLTQDQLKCLSQSKLEERKESMKLIFNCMRVSSISDIVSHVVIYSLIQLIKN